MLSEWTQASEPEAWHSRPGLCGSVFSSLTLTPARPGIISKVQGALAGDNCGARDLRPDLSWPALRGGPILALRRPTEGREQRPIRNHKGRSASLTGVNPEMSVGTLEWGEVTVLQVHRGNRMWKWRRHLLVLWGFWLGGGVGKKSYFIPWTLKV